MRNLRRALLGLAVAGLVVGQGPGAAAAPAAPDPEGFDSYDVITQFDPGEGGAFAESMAPDGDGGMLVSVTTWGIEDATEESGWTSNTGQLWRVGSDGSTTRFGPELDLSPSGMLMGIAVDEQGAVFVALNNFGSDYGMAEDPPSGVLRVTPDGFQRIMTLPEAVYANGLEVNDGTLYVTDSMGGSIWEGPSGSQSTPVAAWFQSRRLEPNGGIGANGIAFFDGALYVASYDQGLILRVPVGRHGGAGTPKVLAKKAALVAADGLTFSEDGLLWVVVNGQYDEGYNLTAPPALVVVDAKGRLATATTPEGSLDYPTAIVFGDDSTVFVSNGSYMFGTPSLVALTR
jgi:sugar lactone lactonase YvrE